MPDPRERDRRLTRDRPVEAARTALLVVDVQNATYNPANDAMRADRPEFYGVAAATVIPNLVDLLAACRAGGVEVIYTVIENLTADGRDRSLDHKLSGFFVARGSWGARVIDAIAPRADEIVLPKTSSSVFNSTNIDYLLRNIGIEDLLVSGFLTDQCIDHTVKDAADRGYFVTCLTDACMAENLARHEAALSCFQGYCRLTTTAAFLALLSDAQGGAADHGPADLRPT